MTSSLQSVNANALRSKPSDSKVGLGSFADFVEQFPLVGEQLYAKVFQRNSAIVQTQKPKFAVANLEKILTATFEVSAVSGFDRMSLRDLSRQTGMSMGAIYSCISKKEDIAVMVADIVGLANEYIRDHVAKVDSAFEKIEQAVRYHLYASTVLQPWYFFLFFETRSLPEELQQASIQIETGAIEQLEKALLSGVAEGEFKTRDARMIANTIVVLLEDWYLKPWKTRLFAHVDGDLAEQEALINNYNRSIIELVEKLVAKA